MNPLTVYCLAIYSARVPYSCDLTFVLCERSERNISKLSNLAMLSPVASRAAAIDLHR